MNGSFFRYVDKGGNMPILTYHSTYIKTHPYYVQYYNNKPVAYHGPQNVLCSDISGTKVWDYSTNSFIDITNIKAV